MRVLILGGTRFVGRRLVDLLVNAGDSVTVATRGRAPVNPAARHVVCDRTRTNEVVRIVQQGTFDVVYDTLAYAPDDMFEVCAAIRAAQARYVVVSSQAVYDAGEQLTELDFDWRSVERRRGSRQQCTYSEGKRLVEAVVHDQLNNAVCVRFPIVLGSDDYTRRLHTLIEAAVCGKPIEVTAAQAKFSLIDSKTAARALFELRECSAVVGGLNVASDGVVCAAQILDWITQATHCRVATTVPCTDDMALLHCPTSFTLSIDKYRQHFSVPPAINAWLPGLIDEIAAIQRGPAAYARRP